MANVRINARNSETPDRELELWWDTGHVICLEAFDGDVSVSRVYLNPEGMTELVEWIEAFRRAP